jgi:hypothetical protein
LDTPRGYSGIRPLFVSELRSGKWERSVSKVFLVVLGASRFGDPHLSSSSGKL